MATNTAASPKVCVKCGKDVATDKRMKDSMGRYWCVGCGAEDQKRKAAGAGAVCDSCGESFPPSQISKWGNRKLCNGCVKRSTKRGGFSVSSLFSGGGGGEKKFPVKLVAIFVLMAIVAVLVWTGVL
jgi:formylmethanofuran dehydrogenase subunit E